MKVAVDTRESWNVATRIHNSHKGDQAAFFRDGGSPLFPEEIELLGDIRGQKLVHLQCNAGQDTLGLAKLGAQLTGVDFSNEAIRFARQLSADSGIPAEFVEADVISWMQQTPERFDIAFSSYGAVCWHADRESWARGIANVLRPGGRFVYVEFHPIGHSIGPDLRLSGDDYFATEPFIAPVGDYVAPSGPGLLALTRGEPETNQVPSASWQHGLGDVVTALVASGLQLEVLREYPWSNGFKFNDALVLGEGRRWHWPEGMARIPLMFALSVRRPG